MAILKRVPDKSSGTLGATKHLVLPAFSFATNTTTAGALAQMIVDAWNNVPFTYTPPGAAAPVTVNLRTALLDRDPTTLLPTQLAIQTATARVDVAGLPAGASGLNLTQAVVITEAEHDEDYVMQSGNEIVLVLPDLDRTTLVPAGAPLLATAEFLMACTPNGI